MFIVGRVVDIIKAVLHVVLVQNCHYKYKLRTLGACTSILTPNTIMYSVLAFGSESVRNEWLV